MRGFPVILALANQMKSPLGEGKQIVIMGIAAARLHKVYRIRSIRCRGYYLFHHAILCESGYYSRAAYIKLSGIGKIFCKCKGFEKSQFYKINKELRCGDLVLKQNTATLATATDTELEESDPFARGRR